MSVAKVYAGTSGWAYASWKPDFYPAKLGSAKFLEYYASRLNAVEVNYTFRAIPKKELLQRWIAATPAGFKFAIKAHQSITHFKRLRDTGSVTREFLDSLEPLRQARKLGPVLFQLRESFKVDVPVLKNFLEELPQGTRAAFEFRSETWFCDEVYETLRRRNVALCLAESGELETPEVITADFSYLRLRKEKYSSAGRASIAKRVTKLAKHGEVFAFFKHEETPDGALHAEELLEPIA
jgi:uncharacterized protein YecE (DUF72 family)